MAARLLRAVDHRRMPWKNGGGETVEIAVHPQGAGLADFGWRISMATVAGDGPFSVFPGVDRTLAVLSGEGIELSIAGADAHSLTPDSVPFAFPADAPVGARLAGGPITDLNVMTRREAFRHRLVRHDVAAPLSLGATTHLRFLLALDPVGAETRDGLIGMAPLDALLLDASTAVTIVPAGDAATVYCAEVEPV